MEQAWERQPVNHVEEKVETQVGQAWTEVGWAGTEVVVVVQVEVERG